MNNTVTEVKIPDYIKVSKLPGENPVLVLHVEPHQETEDPLAEEILRDVLEQHGAKDWLIDQEQLRLLRAEPHSGKAAKSFRIAERRNAQIEIRISPDRQSSSITILPPFGGSPVSDEEIRRALKTAGVTHGILESTIPDLVARGSCENGPIAEATPPKPGSDVSFQRLVAESDHKGHPGATQDGKVDYHDLGLFTSVTKGTPLLKRIPPTPGTPGIAVDGKPIPSAKVRDHRLSPGPGTCMSPRDPNLLIAAVDGLPIFSGNSVKVVNKLELDGINYKTGNVDFEGSVHILGPVQPGFKVKAGGDIVALDTVDSSDLTAGGSIHLRCGVFGRKRSQINAKGDIRAKFLNECTVYCGGNLEVEDLASSCTIACEGKIEAGQGSGKGQICGGSVLATKEIRAKVLGSVSETHTVCEISSSPAATARQQEILNEIKGIKKKLNDLGLSLGYLKGSTARQADARLAPLAKEHQTAAEKLESLQAEMTALSATLHVHSSARILARQVYPGVTVSIGDKREVVQSPQESFVFESSAK